MLLFSVSSSLEPENSERSVNEMAIPYWNASVTIYRKSSDSTGKITWSREFVNGGCFWNHKAQRIRSNGVTSFVDAFTVRIPVPVPDISSGDIVVLGATSWQIDEYSSGLRSADFLMANQERSFTVQRIRMNDDPALPVRHICLEG